MKNNRIIFFVFSLFLCTALFAQKSDTLKVWGNCGMCKKTIETAAKGAGATMADWNTETKILAVSYPENKTNTSKIEQSVATAGYDTRNFTAPVEAYKKLPSCCQYDRKASASPKATAAGLVLKADDCCADGSPASAKQDCCSNGACTDCCKDGRCEKNKQAKSADCCKDGKCASTDCCKKS